MRPTCETGARGRSRRDPRVVATLAAVLHSACSFTSAPEAPANVAPEAPANVEAPAEPVAVSEPEPAPSPAPAPPPEPEAAPGECESHFDCTVVRDRCGRPYGRPLDRPEVPNAPSTCPPASHALVEPSCFEGACETEQVSRHELRTCRRDGDCAVAPAPCGGWLVAQERHTGALRRALEGDVEEIGCPVGRSPVRRPSAACLAGICVARAAGPTGAVEPGDAREAARP